MEALENVTGTKNVLWLWSGTSPTDELQDCVKTLQDRLTPPGHVQMEHVQRLLLGFVQIHFYFVFFSFRFPLNIG